MKTAVDEKRPPHPQIAISHSMADPTANSLAMAYIKYLMDRTHSTAEKVRDAYFSQTGNVPEGNPGNFRKWAGQRVYVMDQLGRDPFAGDA